MNLYRHGKGVRLSPPQERIRNPRRAEDEDQQWAEVGVAVAFDYRHRSHRGFKHLLEAGVMYMLAMRYFNTYFFSTSLIFPEKAFSLLTQEALKPEKKRLVSGAR